MSQVDTWSDARRHARIEIEGGLDASVIATGKPVVLVDVSNDGFQTSSIHAISPGDECAFRVDLGDRTCDVRGRATHCRRPGRGPYMVGWQAGADAATRAGLTAIISVATAPRRLPQRAG